MNLKNEVASPSAMSSTSLSTNSMIKISKHYQNKHIYNKSTNFSTTNIDEFYDSNYKLEILKDLGKYEKETKAML